MFLNRNDQSALNRFLTQAAWDDSDLNRRRVQVELARLRKRPVSASVGRLILDDTFAHHTRCSMAGLEYLRDHTINHIVWAHDVVTSYYVNRADQFPIDFRLYRQFNREWEVPKLQTNLATLTLNPSRAGYQRHLLDLLSFRVREQLFQPKTALATDLVQQAVRLGLPFTVVLFDSWYGRKTLIDALEAHAKY